jgi:hypothetical protein
MKNRIQRKAERFQTLATSKSWSTTFSDLLLLLLTFFALKLSIAGVSATALDTARLAEEAPVSLSTQNDTPSPTEISLVERLDISSLEFRAGTSLNFEESIGAELLTVSLQDGCYVHGTAALTFKSEVVIDAVSRFASDDGIGFLIRSSSSLAEATESPHLSSWDLAAKRAANAARQMIDAGVDSSAIKLAASGLKQASISSDIKEADQSPGCLTVVIQPRNKANKSL